MTPQEMNDETKKFPALFLKISNEMAKRDVIYFYEGIDDIHYYYPILKKYLNGKNHRGFFCYGKENVLRIQKIIKEGKQLKASKNQVMLYFVDKDFQKNKDIDKDVYITPCYSIENHYFSDSAFSNFIIGVFKNNRITANDETDYINAFNYLVSIRSEMIEDVIFSNAWLSLLVKDKEKHPFHVVAARKVKEYSNIKGVKKVSDLDNLALFPSGLTDEEVEKEVKNLRIDPINLIRGKYFEQVFTEPLKKLIEKKNDKNDSFFLNHESIDCQIGKDSLIMLFANYADVPDQLYDYIENKFKKKLFSIRRK